MATKTQPITIQRRRPGLVAETFNTGTEAVRTTLSTVNTTLQLVSKSAEIVDIKLDEIKLESWADLQETRVATFARLSQMGMSEEDIRTSFDAHGFK